MVTQSTQAPLLAVVSTEDQRGTGKRKRRHSAFGPTSTSLPQLDRYLDQVFWYSPIPILYGADFKVDDNAPETIHAREVYYIAESLPVPKTIEMETPTPPQFIAYCVYQYDEKSAARDSCPPTPLNAGFIETKYEIYLKSASDLDDPQPPYTTYGQFFRNGALHQSIRFSAREVWVLLKYSQTDLRWRLLRRARFLQDAFGKEGETGRMTTFYMPKNTFIALDVAQKEVTPDRDIVDYPRVYAGEFWLTRINPHTPLIIRWPLEKLTAVGISNLIIQWMSVAIPPFAAVIAFFVKLFRSRDSNFWNFFRKIRAQGRPVSAK